jgi:hypothetical protein
MHSQTSLVQGLVLLVFFENDLRRVEKLNTADFSLGTLYLLFDKFEVLFHASFDPLR